MRFGGGFNRSIDQNRVDMDLKDHGPIGNDTTTLAGRTIVPNPAAELDADALHILFFGQSNNNSSLTANAGDAAPGRYPLANPTKVLNMSIGHRGAVFYAKDPLLSADGTDSHNGMVLADQLINAGLASKVVISNCSIGGTFCGDWVVGGAYVQNMTYRRGDAAYRIGLAQRCIKAAGLDHVRTIIDWAQGEWDSDTPTGTSQSLYQASLQLVISEMKRTNLLRVGRVMFVHKTTRLINSSERRDPVRAAQAAVVDDGLVRAGIDMDAIPANHPVTGRVTRPDGTHYGIDGGDLLAAGKRALIAAWIAEG